MRVILNKGPHNRSVFSLFNRNYIRSNQPDNF